MKNSTSKLSLLLLGNNTTLHSSNWNMLAASELKAKGHQRGLLKLSK